MRTARGEAWTRISITWVNWIPAKFAVRIVARVACGVEVTLSWLGGHHDVKNEACLTKWSNTS